MAELLTITEETYKDNNEPEPKIYSKLLYMYGRLPTGYRMNLSGSERG